MQTITIDLPDNVSIPHARRSQGAFETMEDTATCCFYALNGQRILGNEFRFRDNNPKKLTLFLPYLTTKQPQ